MTGSPRFARPWTSDIHSTWPVYLPFRQFHGAARSRPDVRAERTSHRLHGSTRTVYTHLISAGKGNSAGPRLGISCRGCLSCGVHRAFWGHARYLRFARSCRHLGSLLFPESQDGSRLRPPPSRTQKVCAGNEHTSVEVTTVDGLMLFLLPFWSAHVTVQCENTILGLLNDWNILAAGAAAGAQLCHGQNLPRSRI